MFHKLLWSVVSIALFNAGLINVSSLPSVAQPPSTQHQYHQTWTSLSAIYVVPRRGIPGRRIGGGTR